MFYDIIYENGVAENREQAIETLCRRLYGEGRIADLKAFENAVRKRESEASTELAPNVFVPHAKSEAVLNPAVARMKTRSGDTVYLIASNSDDGHIKALSELAAHLNTK